MNAKQQLKKLILDPSFHRLSELQAKEETYFSILGIENKELRHSNMLAWLFNPKGGHGLGDRFLKEFIKQYFSVNEYEDFGLGEATLSVFDFVKLDLQDAEVRREFNNIDILVVSEKASFILVIENKIRSRELSGQLEKYRNHIEVHYPDWKFRIYVYLSLFPQGITEEDWYEQLNYEHIYQILETIQTESIDQHSSFIINDYKKTLHNMLYENKEIEALARQVYKEHKESFDLVFKYALSKGNKSHYSQVPNDIETWILEDKRVTPFRFSRVYKSFVPQILLDELGELKREGIFPPEYDPQNHTLLTWEFEITQDRIHFGLVINPYPDQKVRKQLQEHLIAFNADGFFNQVDRSLRKNNHRVHTEQLIGEEAWNEFEESEDTEAFLKLVREKYEYVIGVLVPEAYRRLKGASHIPNP